MQLLATVCWRRDRSDPDVRECRKPDGEAGRRGGLYVCLGFIFPHEDDAISCRCDVTWQDNRGRACWVIG